MKLEKVNHPFISIIVALLSIVASIGGGSAFWQYLSDRETSKMENRLQSLEIEMKVKDLEGRLAAEVLLRARLGEQLKTFQEAFDKLTRGQRTEARRISATVEIPDAQGLPIVGGQVFDPPDQIKATKAKLRAEYDELNEMLIQRKR